MIQLKRICSSDQEHIPEEIIEYLHAPSTKAAIRVNHMRAYRSSRSPHRTNLRNQHHVNHTHKSRSITLVIICNTALCLISLIIKLVGFVIKRLHDNNVIDNIQYYYVLSEEAYHVVNVIESSANFFICLICSRQFRKTC